MTEQATLQRCVGTNDHFKQPMNNQDRTIERLSVCGKVLNESYGVNDHKIYIAKAYGAYIEDFDGNKYIDTAMGAGTHLLGHTPAFLVERMIEQLRLGSLYITPNFHAHEFADLLSSVLPQYEGFVFCNTGSEATLRAIRIARAYSRKKKIAVFSGGYHGSHDVVLVEEDYRGDASRPKAVHRSNGIPKEFLDFIVMLPYNDSHAFDIIREKRDEIAMVFIEPAQGSNPRDDVGGFLKDLRRVTEENGILLGFDEMITGFRVALGGAQEYFGVQADIATYGKTIGGGMPIGLVAGKRAIMNAILAGTPGDQPVFMGGTFSANPLSMVSGKTALEYFVAHRKDIYGRIDAAGKRLKTAVNSFCIEKNIPVRMIGIGSMLRLIFTDKPVKSRRERDQFEMDSSQQNLFYTAMLKSGVHIAPNRIIFLSAAHSEEDVDAIVSAFKDNLREAVKIGIFHDRT